jgi:hypothetical protein
MSELTPEETARHLQNLARNTAQVKAATASKSSGRVAKEFYLVPVPWADRAVEALAGKSQLILAFRLYRRWRTRKSGEATITVSNKALAGPGYSRDSKRRMLRKLAKAGLLEILEQRPGLATRVRIIEPA